VDAQQRDFRYPGDGGGQRADDDQALIRAGFRVLVSSALPPCS
jgi:hypothetical protein